MSASIAGPEGVTTVTGTLLDLIQRGKVATDRLVCENARLQQEIARLTQENTELRARLARSRGETPS